MPTTRLLACAAVLIAVLVLLACCARGAATERSHVHPLLRGEYYLVLLTALRVLTAEGSAVRRAMASVDLASGGSGSGNGWRGKKKMSA
ncbi:MAG: hypothetical protein PHO20_04560 [Candidatus Peribacteraceae bacterium]|nr:hypothetical protein [Candidatus Peribacteraceae bacterium]MDD5740012.1 hypothetical protein [Candidatus Peribacteraceae bacterium]